MILRPKYLNQLVKEKNNGFPKVITGIRRCGKSFLLKEIYKNYLLENGVKENSILILELDDVRNAKYRDPLELSKFVRKFCRNKKDCYIFLDEIQKVLEKLKKYEFINEKKMIEEIISFCSLES